LHEEKEVSRTKTSQPAREYKVTQIHGNSRANTSLDLVTLTTQEAKREKTSFLLDTGATLTLIKLRNLKDETPTREKRMVLTGVTGHKIHTTGKIRATIPLRNRRIPPHNLCGEGRFPLIDYEGILGIDSLQKQQATCDLCKKRLRLRPLDFLI